MKKLVILFFFLFSSLFASGSEDIFQSKCVLCHAESMDISEVNNKIKAPPMNMISMRLKSAIKTKKEFISFVKDYIQSPSKEKEYCMQMAYERFGMMPAIGTTMSEQDRDLIANRMYNNFSRKDLTSNNNDMKCESK